MAKLEVKVGGSIDTEKVKGETGTPVIVNNEPRTQRKDPDVRFISSDKAYIDTNVDGNLVVGSNLYVDGEIKSSEGTFEPLPSTTGKVGKVLKVDTDSKAKWLDEGSGNQKYMHFVRLLVSAYGQTFTYRLQIVNDKSDAFTTEQDLAEWLYDNQYRDIYNMFETIVNGYPTQYSTDAIITLIRGIYSSNRTSIVAPIESKTFTLQDGEFIRVVYDSTNGSVDSLGSDTVVAL